MAALARFDSGAPLFCAMLCCARQMIRGDRMHGLREQFIDAYAQRLRIEQAAETAGARYLLRAKLVPSLARLREEAKRELSAAEYRHAVAIAFERAGRSAEAAFILAE